MNVPIFKPPPKPWSQEKRERVRQKIARLAGRVRRELGSYSCLIVATFDDGEALHIIDGGTAPTPSIGEFYDAAKAMHLRDDMEDTGFKAAGSSN